LATPERDISNPFLARERRERLLWTLSPHTSVINSSSHVFTQKIELPKKVQFFSIKICLVNFFPI